ncbi:hypothetical protein [Pedobacter arcticus]|uniref:hypothetical protein n=1 Tax=Pedobacter arcticus TaxID=752140 RepID=UPI0002ED0806|nr:hypothetical protein [Pedobacter arcticus]
MKLQPLLLLIFIGKFAFAQTQGVWTKPVTTWKYDLGANTGTGVLNSGIGYTTETTGGNRVSTASSNQGFLPYPPSGSAMLSNIATPPVGTGEWSLENYLSSASIKFISSRAGRVAKFSLYNIGNASPVSSFFYKISFADANVDVMDWRFGIGLTNGRVNQLNNTTAGIPGNTSKTSFPNFFATLRWAAKGSEIPFSYCYRGVEADGESEGNTYERKLNGATFSKGGTYNMEFYCNNSSGDQHYLRNKVDYAVPANSFHIWVNSVQLTANGSPNIGSYQLVPNLKLDAFVFQGSTSIPAKAAVCYISDFLVNQVQNPLK